jgi:hypothetical protein
MKEKAPLLTQEQLHQGAGYIFSQKVRETIQDVLIDQRDADALFYEAKIEEARRETAKELYREVICPMCYRLNPQHATADNGIGCQTCREKEERCG